MPITNPEELKMVIKDVAEKERLEKEALIERILSYKSMNEIVRQQARLPCLENFSDPQSIVSWRHLFWTWDKKRLNDRSVEILKSMASHAEKWDKFIYQWMEHQKGTEK